MSSLSFDYVFVYEKNTTTFQDLIILKGTQYLKRSKIIVSLKFTKNGFMNKYINGVNLKKELTGIIILCL